MKLLLRDSLSISEGRQRPLKLAIAVANEIREIVDSKWDNVSNVFQEQQDKTHADVMSALGLLNPFSFPAPQVILAARKKDKTDKETEPQDDSDTGKRTFKAILTEGEPMDRTPEDVNVVNQLTKEDMKEAQYEAGLLLKYGDKIDEWHLISKTKYNWTGWAAIAENEEAASIAGGKKKRTKRQMESFEEKIRRDVEAHRERLGITRESL